MFFLNTNSSENIQKLAVFLFAGAIGFFTELLLIRILIVSFNLDPLTGRVFSFPIAVLITWYINRTYGYRILAPPTIGELIRYFKTNIISQSANLSIFTYLTWTYPLFQQFPELALAIGTTISVILSFLLYNLFVFKKISDPETDKKQHW